MTLLAARDLSAGYGDLTVLWAVGLEVDQGEIVAVLGPNGAGKTTLLMSLAGMVAIRRGAHLEFDGVDLIGRSAPERVRRGIVAVPEGGRLFRGLTIEENLRLGAHVHRSKQGVKEGLELCYSTFPRLYERRSQLAGTLSGGEQRMCAVSRAVMARPRLLLIDEMSLGLAPIMVDVMVNALTELRASSELAMIVVEQNVQVALDLADRGYVLARGEIVASGTATEIQQDQRTLERAFFG